MKQRREFLGLSIADLARGLNMLHQNVLRMEKKRFPILEGRLRRIAIFLNTSLDYLFGLTDDPAPRSNNNFEFFCTDTGFDDMTIDYPTFCSNIKIIRESYNIPLKKISNATGISSTSYRHMEEGRFPTLEPRIRAITQYLCVPLDFLFGLSDDPRPSPAMQRLSHFTHLFGLRDIYEIGLSGGITEIMAYLESCQAQIKDFGKIFTRNHITPTAAN